MAEDREIIMLEPYKEFSNSQRPNTDLTFKNYTFKLREVVLAVVAAVAVVTTIGLSIALGVSQAGTRTICATRGCLEASSYIIRNLNTTVKPCDDFYSYACGKLEDRTSIRADDESYTDQNRERLQALIVRPVARQTEHSWERKVKELYTSCTDQFEKVDCLAGANPFLQQLVPRAGGWWMVNDSWNSNGSWDLTTAMQKVHVDFWTDALFKFSVEKFSGYNIVQIDFSGLGMAYLEYTEHWKTSQMARAAYKQFMRTLAELFMKDASTSFTDQQKQERIDTFVKDVFDFEAKLANLYAKFLHTDDHGLYGMYSGQTMEDTLIELNGFAPLIDWVRFFKYMFKDTAIMDSWLVQLKHDSNHLSNVSALVSNLGTNQSRIMNNYLMWRMAHKYAQFLSWHFVQANKKFNRNRSMYHESFETWATCLHYIEGTMGTALEAMFVRNHFDTRYKQGVETMLSYLKVSVKDMLKNAEWMEDRTRTEATKKIDTINYQVGFPDLLLPENDALIDDMYKDLKVVKHLDFFHNVLSMDAWQRKVAITRLKKGPHESVWRIKVYDVSALYDSQWNEICVTAGMLKFPVYDKKVPNYMNYGSLGTKLSRQLLKAVTGTYLWSKGQDSQEHRQTGQCIIDYFNNKTNNRIADDNTVKAVIHDVFSLWYSYLVPNTYDVKQAYLAYHKWVKDNHAEPVAPGLNLTADQAFFVSYGQTFCNKRDVGNWGPQSLIPKHIMLNGAVAQLDEFQQAFSCPSTAKLNEKKKCNLF